MARLSIWDLTPLRFDFLETLDMLIWHFPLFFLTFEVWDCRVRTPEGMREYARRMPFSRNGEVTHGQILALCAFARAQDYTCDPDYWKYLV